MDVSDTLLSLVDDIVCSNLGWSDVVLGCCWFVLILSVCVSDELVGGCTVVSNTSGPSAALAADVSVPIPNTVESKAELEAGALQDRSDATPSAN